MQGRIAVIVEHAEGEINPVTYEVAAAGVYIGSIVRGRVVLVVVGEDLTRIAPFLYEATGLPVCAVEVPGLGFYNGEVYRQVLGVTLTNLEAAYVCMANTTQGMDLAPGLSVRLNAACVTGVEAIDRDGERLVFSRSMIGGKVTARVRADAPVTVLTIQSGVFRAHGSGDAVEGSAPSHELAAAVEFRKMDCAPRRSRSLGIREGDLADAGLANARIIVAAGRGVGTLETLEQVRRLAATFPSATFAASRPLCDLGWVEYPRQVGITGSTVAPDLYIACGISGAIQHVLGMRGSGFVAAINIDPNAAMFRDADVCIVEDLSTFIPILIKSLHKRGNADANPLESE